MEQTNGYNRFYSLYKKMEEADSKTALKNAVTAINQCITSAKGFSAAREEETEEEEEIEAEGRGQGIAPGAGA